MSNLEDRPDEITCTAVGAAGVEVMAPREVPLGGPRAMRVRRTLPQRHRSLIEAPGAEALFGLLSNVIDRDAA